MTHDIFINSSMTWGYMLIQQEGFCFFNLDNTPNQQIASEFNLTRYCNVTFNGEIGIWYFRNASNEKNDTVLLDEWIEPNVLFLDVYPLVVYTSLELLMSIGMLCLILMLFFLITNCYILGCSGTKLVREYTFLRKCGFTYPKCRLYKKMKLKGVHDSISSSIADEKVAISRIFGTSLIIVLFVNLLIVLNSYHYSEHKVWKLVLEVFAMGNFVGIVIFSGGRAFRDANNDTWGERVDIVHSIFAAFGSLDLIGLNAYDLTTLPAYSLDPRNNLKMDGASLYENMVSYGWLIFSTSLMALVFFVFTPAMYKGRNNKEMFMAGYFNETIGLFGLITLKFFLNVYNYPLLFLSEHYFAYLTLMIVLLYATTIVNSLFIGVLVAQIINLVVWKDKIEIPEGVTPKKIIIHKDFLKKEYEGSQIYKSLNKHFGFVFNMYYFQLGVGFLIMMISTVIFTYLPTKQYWSLLLISLAFVVPVLLYDNLNYKNAITEFNNNNPGYVIDYPPKLAIGWSLHLYEVST